MSNLCHNHIRINGDVKTISIISQACKRCEGKEDERIFQNLIGIPEYMSLSEYEKNWYNTNMTWFGTKTDVTYESCDLYFDETEIIINIETAWSPPIEFLNNLVKMYKVKAYIFYSESSDFCGEANVYLNEDGGLVTDDVTYDYLEGLYRLSKDEFYSEVEYHIDNCRDDYETEDDVEKIVYPDEYITNYVNDTFTFLDGQEKEEIIKQFKEELNGN